jgi:hypothetical protein
VDPIAGVNIDIILNVTGLTQDKVQWKL